MRLHKHLPGDERVTSFLLAITPPSSAPCSLSKTTKTCRGIIASKTESANIVAKSIIDQSSRQDILRIKSFVNYKTSETKKQLI